MSDTTVLIILSFLSFVALGILQPLGKLVKGALQSFLRMYDEFVLVAF